MLAPDLFWRSQPNVELKYDQEGFAKGMDLASKLDKDQALNDLSDAINTLHQLPSVSGKTGVVGFCLGGNTAYRLACHNLVDAAVSYYGGGIDQILDEAKKFKMSSFDALC